MGKLMAPKKTKDGVEILYNLFVRGKPDMERMLEEEQINAEIAQQIYDLRTQAGLSQKKLAERIGTQASVICRLEDADYEGHSLAMLKRIAAALNHRVEVHLIPGKAAEKPRKGSRQPRSAVARRPSPRKDRG